MYNFSDNIDFIIGDETDKIIEDLFDSFLKRYQEKLEKSMKGIEFVYDSIDLLHYKFHGLSLNRGGSYRDFPKWLKNKKATISPKKNDNKCFQYAITVALNHEQIKSHPERIANIKLFIVQHDSKERNFQSNKRTL